MTAATDTRRRDRTPPHDTPDEPGNIGTGVEVVERIERIRQRIAWAAVHGVDFTERNNLEFLLDQLADTKAKLTIALKRADWEGGEHDKFKSEELRQRLRAEAADSTVAQLKARGAELGARAEAAEKERDELKRRLSDLRPDIIALGAISDRARALLSKPEGTERG